MGQTDFFVNQCPNVARCNGLRIMYAGMYVCTYACFN